MVFFAMDLGWKRAHHLVIILIFLKHAVAYEGWLSQNVQPQLNWPVHKPLSLKGIQSSVLEAPVTRSIPVEEVAPNMVPGKSLNARKSRFSLSHQDVKGGFSSSYEPMSHTQSAPSILDGTSSLLKLLGSSSPSAQNVVRQGSYSWSSQDGSGLQLGGASSPLATQSSSSTGSSGSSRRLFTTTYQGSSGPQLAEGSSQLVSTSGLLTQPPSAESQLTSGSSYAKLAASPLGFSQATSGQSSYSQYTSSSQSRVGTQLAASHQYVPGQGSGYGLSVQPQSITSQYAPAFSLGAKKMSSQYYQATRSGSLSPSQSSQGWQPSITKTQGFQASSKAVSQGSGTSPSSIWSPSRFSSLQYQSTSSQNAPALLGAKKGPVYSQAAPSGSLSLGRPSQLHPPASKSPSFQTSGAVASQGSSPSQGFKAPSRLSTSAASPGQFASTQEGSARYSGLSIQFPSTSSQYSPESSGYTKLAASSLGVSQSTSGHGSYRQYTSSSQSRAGTQLAGSSHYVPVQTSSTTTDGSSLQLQGTSGPYAPLNAKVYSQAAPSGPSLSPSQSSQWQTPRWSQGFQTSGTVASQSSSPSQGSKDPSKFSTLTSAASPGHFASTQGSGKYSGLFSLSQGTSSQYNPESSGYTKLASSPLGISQSTSGHGSYRQYTSSSQSRAGTQLAGSSHYVPVQTGSTSTDGSSLHLQGTSNQYVPAALGEKLSVYSQTGPSGSLSLSHPSQWQPSFRWSQGFLTSGTVASQSSSPSQGSKDPSRFSTSAVSPGQFVTTPVGSARYSGLSSLSQGTSSQYSPWSSGYTKLAASPLGISQSTSGHGSYRQYTSSSQSRAGTHLAGSGHYVPVQTGSTSTDGSSLRLQGTSSQYAPLNAKVYSQAAPSGPSLSPSQSSQWQTSSRWSQGFQTSGTVASPGSSPSQVSKAPSRFSTSAVHPGQLASTQKENGRYGGLFSLSQSASTQYIPGSPAYAKRGSSLEFSSQSTSDPSSSGLYASSSQSMAGTQLAGSSYVPAQTGSTFSGASLQGTSNQYAPSVSSQYTRASPSESSLTVSEAFRKWQPSASPWSQWFQASGTDVPQSSSSPQSVLPALGPSMDSVAQSFISSSRRNSIFGTGLGPSKLSAQAASGSAVSSQISPGLSASVHHPSGSMTSSLGSSVQGVLQGTFSGQSSDSTSRISSSYGSTYGQKASGFSRPSQSSSATGLYSSSVKG